MPTPQPIRCRVPHLSPERACHRGGRRGRVGRALQTCALASLEPMKLKLCPPKPASSCSDQRATITPVSPPPSGPRLRRGRETHHRPHDELTPPPARTPHSHRPNGPPAHF